MRKNNGFASILVLIMAVIIFSVGFSIMSSAKNTDNLALKKFEFIRDYYYIEGEVNHAIVMFEKLYSKSRSTEAITQEISRVLANPEVECAVLRSSDEEEKYIVLATYKNSVDGRGIEAVLEKGNAGFRLVEKKYVFNEEGYESIYAK